MSNPQKPARPNLERLTRRLGKYALVVTVSQRARELKERQARFGEANQSYLIGRSLVEINSGKVKLLDDEENS